MNPLQAIMHQMPVTSAMMSVHSDAMIVRLTEFSAPPELIDEFLRQTHGGSCPTCGKAYVQIHVENRYADFHYFQPRCWKDREGHWQSCLDRKVVHRKEDGTSEMVDTLDEIGQALLDAQVPRKLTGCSFPGWHYQIDERNDEAMKAVYNWCRTYSWKEHGLVLYGRVGAGKTHCAIAVLRMVLEASPTKPIRFVLMGELLKKIVGKDDTYREWIATGELVVFDDFDKLGASDNEWVQIQVLALIDRLLLEDHRLIITTNLSGEGLAAKFGEALVSRLMGACDMVHFAGEDYRPRILQFPTGERRNP